jgi:hypothetical protein
VPFGFGADRSAVRISDQVRPRENDDTRAPERSNGLAKQPAWAQVRKPKWLEGIEQDDIEIARQPAVLEPIVEHDQLAFELHRGDPCEASAIRTLKMRNIRKILFEYPPLIVHSACVTITAAEYDDPNSTLAKPPRDPLDHRRLARSTERQISDGNDRHRRPLTSQPAMIETKIASGDDRAIDERGNTQPATCQPRKEPAWLAADQS